MRRKGTKDRKQKQQIRLLQKMKEIQQWRRIKKLFSKKKKIRLMALTLFAMMLLSAFPFSSLFSVPFSGIIGPIQANAAIGLGIETIYDDEVWMGWTIFESGNVGYGQAGGDGGKAYGRYQFDYRYALPGFLALVVAQDPIKYSMLSKYTHYGAGSDKLLSGAGLGNDWVRAYQADREEFSQMQDEYAYDQYYLPAKQIMKNHGIDLDEIDDPMVKGTIYSFSIRDGAYDSCLSSAWQTYSPGDDISTWLNKMYQMEAKRHPTQDNRWKNEQRIAALNGATTGYLSDLGAILTADGTVYQDYVKNWIEKYPSLSEGFKESGGWNDDNKVWAMALRGIGNWQETYGIKGGSLDFAGATSGGMYISDVIVDAKSLSIPDNGSSMPVVYMAQSGGQPWSNIPFGGGTIATSGCSVTSLAMVLSYIKSDEDSSGWIYPSDIVAAIAKKYGNYNHFHAKEGQKWDIFPAVAGIYKVSCKQINAASIMHELKAGHPVIMSCKPSEFTSGGHFIVLSGLTDDGYITVNDPNAAHASYSYKKYPVFYLINCGKGWWAFSA